MSDDTFLALCRYFSAEPDGNGNVWIDCPDCGRKNRKCSFDREHGAHCFRCNYKASLKMLADRVLGPGFTAPPSKPFLVKPPKVRAWQRQADVLAASFTQTPGVIEAWRAYKPLPAPLISLYKLGYGVFPQLYFDDGTVSIYGEPAFISKDGQNWWQCSHKRLIIPLVADGKVVGFRCRAIDCNCPRWLSPGGSKLVLYNGAVLLPPAERNHNLQRLLGDSSHSHVAGKKLLVVENPIDAILAQHNWNVLAVATLGVSIWKLGWTKIMAANKPSATLVAFDHDLAGNGGGKENGALQARWLSFHGTPATEPAGLRRVREFQKAHIKARLHDWGDAPIGTDVGDLLKTGAGIPDFTPQALPGINQTAKSQTLPLVTWFVTEYLGLAMRPEDYHGSHMAHAKQMLTRYTPADMMGCLKAIRLGYLDWPMEVTYLTQLTKGEPPLMARWREFCETPPPLWQTYECQQWQELTGRDLPTEPTEPEDSRMPMWPPGMRPAEVAA